MVCVIKKYLLTRQALHGSLPYMYGSLPYIPKCCTIGPLLFRREI